MTSPSDMSDFNLTRNYPLGNGNFSPRHSTPRKHCTMVDSEADTVCLDELFHSTCKYANEISSRICDRNENEKRAMGDNSVELCKDVETDLLFTEVTTKSTDYYRGLVQDKLSTRRDILEKTQQDMADSFNHLFCSARQVENSEAYSGLYKELQNLRALVKVLEVAAERFGVSNSESRFLGDLEKVVRCIESMNRQYDSALCEIEKLRVTNKELWEQTRNNTVESSYQFQEVIKQYSPYEGESTILHGNTNNQCEENKCSCQNCKLLTVCESDNKIPPCDDQICRSCQDNKKAPCLEDQTIHDCQKFSSDGDEKCIAVPICESYQFQQCTQCAPKKTCNTCTCCEQCKVTITCKSCESNNVCSKEPCKVSPCKTAETCNCVKMKCGYPKIPSKTHQPCEPCKPCVKKKLCESCKSCWVSKCNCHKPCDPCKPPDPCNCKSCSICQSCDQCGQAPPCQSCQFCKPCQCQNPCSPCQKCQPCQCPPNLYSQLQHVCFSVSPPCGDITVCPEEPCSEDNIMCPCPSDDDKCQPCLAQPRKKKKRCNKKEKAICDEEPCEKKPRKSKKKCMSPKPCPIPCPVQPCPPCPPTPCPTETCPPGPCPIETCPPAPCPVAPCPPGPCPPYPVAACAPAVCPPERCPPVPCPQDSCPITWPPSPSVPCPPDYCAKTWPPCPQPPCVPTCEKSCCTEPLVTSMQTTRSNPCPSCDFDGRCQISCNDCQLRRNLSVSNDAAESNVADLTQCRDKQPSRVECNETLRCVPIMTDEEMQRAAQARRRKKMFWIGIALLTTALLIILACQAWEWFKTRTATEDALCKSCSPINVSEETTAINEQSWSLWDLLGLGYLL